MTRTRISNRIVAATILAAAITVVLSSSAVATEHENYYPELSAAIVARAVQNRVPSETEGPFEADGERLYIHMEFNNPDVFSDEFTVNWRNLDSGREFSQSVDVGQSSRWRTWVYHRMTPRNVGRWEVEIVSGEGLVEQTLAFEVIPEIEDSVEEPPAVTSNAISSL